MGTPLAPTRRTTSLVGATPAASAVDPRGRRRWAGILTATVILSLEVIRLPVIVRDGRLNLHFVMLVIVTLSVFTILSLRSDEVGVTRPPLRGSIAAVLLGSLLSAGLTLGIARWPSLGALVENWDVDRNQAWQPLQMARFAAFIGVLQVGVYSVAFIVPAGLERERIRALEVANLRLEAEELRVHAELARLRMQLEPHFLLNTLNLVSGLVTIDPDKARTVLGDLGDLLRDALVDGGELQSLDAELAWLRRYLAILCSRHGELLTVEWRVDDDALAGRLPRLVLQPLVENAVQHGVLRRPGGGRVSISASRVATSVGPRLRCAVRNDLAGHGGGAERDGAIGVENVRRRLALNCPGSTFTLRFEPDACVAELDLPFETQPRAAEVAA